MKLIAIAALASVLLAGCEPGPAAYERVTSIEAEDWNARTATISPQDSLENGATYLSSYSQIYTSSENSKFNLTGTISMRNINLKDTLFIRETKYYNTGGKEIRKYFDHPIYLAPMETLEIIIVEKDIEGGTGDNFVFEWSKTPGTHDPYFEGIFISTYGQQGISFTTRGVRIE